MKKPVLNGKSILAVNEDLNVLAVLAQEILEACPNCTFGRAATLKEARERLASYTYQLVICDITGVRNFELLDRAFIKKIPVVILSAYPFSLEAFVRHFNTRSISFLPMENLGGVVPFLEGVLSSKDLPRWKRLVRALKTSFQAPFDPDWDKIAGQKCPSIETGLK